MTDWKERNCCLGVVGVIFIALMDVQCSAETYDMKRETCLPSITCWKVLAHSLAVQSQTNRILQGALFLLPRNTRNCMHVWVLIFLIKYA